jgi:GNAT superfamily N-acetyltransferase
MCGQRSAPTARKKRLDQKKNPFFRHAEAQYFLACVRGVRWGASALTRIATSTSSRGTCGWVKALRERKKIDAIRVIILGVTPAYRHTGVAARLYQMHFDAAERTPQKGGEMGWTLEVNEPMNRA